MKNDKLVDLTTHSLNKKIERSILKPLSESISAITQCKIQISLQSLKVLQRPCAIRLKNENGYIVGKFTLRGSPLLMMFSDQAVFHIMDLVAGGQEAHRTIIENKPSTELDLFAFDLIFKNALTGIQSNIDSAISYEDTLSGLTAAKAAMRMTDSYEVEATLVEPKGEHSLKLLVPVPAINCLRQERIIAKQNVRPLVDWKSTLDAHRGLIKLDDETAFNWILSELPQTGALILHLLDKNQAARILEKLPQPFSSDIGVRFISMHLPNPDFVELVGEFAKYGVGQKAG